MRTVSLLIVLASIFQLTGCATALVPKRVYLESTARYGELVKLQEAQLAKSEKASAADLYNLCYAYSKVKDYAKLFDCTDKLEKQIKAGDTKITLYTSIFESDGSPTPYLLRAEAYIELSQYGKAISQATEGYRLSKRVANTFFGNEIQHHMINSLGLLALAYTFAGDIPKARENLKTLENLSLPFAGSAVTEPTKNRAIGRVYMALGEFGKALEIMSTSDGGFARAIGSTIVGGGENVFTTLELPNTYMRAKCLLETGDISKAKEEYDNLLNNEHSQDVGEIYWMLLFDRGHIAEKEGIFKEAVGYYRQAVDVIEQQRATINTEASKIGFVGDKQAVYRHIIAALYADRQYAAAFEYVERSKARALVDMLAAKQDFAITSDDPAKVRKLLAMVSQAERDALMQGTSTGNSQTRGLVLETRQQLNAELPELASLVNVSTLTVSEIQALIPQDEALIEYYYNAPYLIVFVLTAKGLNAVRLDSRGLLDNVRRYRKLLESTHSSDYLALSMQLYNQLVRPFPNQINVKKLIVVAHGPLHYLPFNALHDGQDYLIELYSLRMLPSASVLKYLRAKSTTKQGNILAFGNPDLGSPEFDLPNAQTEAIAITKNCPQSRVLLRKDANEAALRQYGGAFRHLHFATHGEFNADAPLKSALLLARDAQNDGRLTVDKLYSLKLNADLVTLSACETGLGNISNGDDVVGLTRGFLYAGSRTIVSSLWQVDDLATSYLMTRFYDNLNVVDKREALRRAQRETLKKFSHPFYWAAFQITGNGK